MVSKSRRKFNVIKTCCTATLLALCVVFSGARAGDLPVNNAGARVFIDFTNTQFDNVTVFGNLNLPDLTGIAGLPFSVQLGPFRQDFMLDANGHDQTPLGIVDVRKGKSGVHFLMTAQAADLIQLYGSAGLTGDAASLKTVSLDLKVLAGPATFTATLPGLYNATAGKFGRAFLGVISDDAKLKQPKVQITSVKVTPSPASINQVVTFKGEVSIKELTGDVVGHLAYGDNTPPLRTDGATLQTMLKAGIQHTYASDGAFEARLAFGGDNEVLATRIYVVVGTEVVVNPLNGSITRLHKNASGNVTLTHTVHHIPNAVSAMTVFKDLNGNPVGVPRSDERATMPADPQGGLSISRTFSLPGIYIAEITPLDAGNKGMGMLRKTIAINSTDIGASSAPKNSGSSAEVATARATTDATINLSTVSGKFLFTSSKQDKVLFTGTVTLPAGYTPAQSGGNDITVSLGNVIDTVHLNEKNKAVFPTSAARITKFSLTLPKLTSGVAAGTETAKVSINLSVANLDILGFNSDGISSSVRSDETTLTSVQRYIQVSMLLAGRTFSTLASIEYKLNSNSDFGTISGRAGN